MFSIALGASSWSRYWQGREANSIYFFYKGEKSVPKRYVSHMATLSHKGDWEGEQLIYYQSSLFSGVGQK